MNGMAWLTVLGIPAGLYVASIVALMNALLGEKQNPVLLLAVVALTLGIYVYHRTTVVCVEPMQERHRIAIALTKKLRVLSTILLLVSAFVFATEKTVLSGMVLLAILGVVVYGRKTCIQPLRNNAYIKPIAVGSSIAVFAWALNDFSNTPWVLLAFVLLCSADALLCDLVDCAYDAASGCTTLAFRLGVHKTWCFAGVLYFCAFLCLGFPFGLLFLLLLPIPLLWPRFTRTLIDVRPLLVLLLAYSL
jgi:4-hydroxybenzoate polyprenyltransferase